jgi:hypothetical protein
MLGDVPSGRPIQATERELRNAEIGLMETVEALANLLRAAEQGKRSSTLADRIAELTLQRDELETEARELRDAIAESSPANIHARAEELSSALSAKPIERTRANALMRQVFSRISIDTNSGELLFDWNHGGQSAIICSMPMHEAPARTESAKTQPPTRKRRR